jgi:hypothetical protein
MSGPTEKSHAYRSSGCNEIAIARLRVGLSMVLASAVIAGLAAFSAYAMPTGVACAGAHVSYAPPPDRQAPKLPWVRAGTVTGYLFYYSAPGPWKTRPSAAIIATRGGTASFNTKILWRIRGGYGEAVVTGRQLDGDGRFTQRFRGVPGSQFPSTVVVPTAGCWRVTVTNHGHRASFTFAAVDL